MHYTPEEISTIVQGRMLRSKAGQEVSHVLLDSRKVYFPADSVFFALAGPRRDGHDFLEDLYGKGIRIFVIAREEKAGLLPDATVILVDDTLHALQELARHHRHQFRIPVVGITGSNGKTIVKEWLYQLLLPDYRVIRSPKSYNSQIGVPLSVFGMAKEHNLALFEAGISQPGEMKNLQQILDPDTGILTSLGEAHNAGFEGMKEKLLEKLILFRDCKQVIFNKTILDAYLGPGEIDGLFPAATVYDWSREQDAWLTIDAVSRENDTTRIGGRNRGNNLEIVIPFTDEASIENAITCWCYLLSLDMKPESVVERMWRLEPVDMRLAFKKGINNCIVINDSYSADLTSLSIALNFLDQRSADGRKTVILSDFLESGMKDQSLYRQIAVALELHGVTRLIAIGPQSGAHLKERLARSAIRQEYFSDTESFLNHFRFSQFRDESILVKGARRFEFEQVARLLEQKVHETVLEINLGAIVHNLKLFQKHLAPRTRIMVMVKAFAYGSGGAEIAGVLQYHKADYLGVAYTDEGVELRKSGISLPVMVLNAEATSFDTMVSYQLEPVIYSRGLLTAFEKHLQQSGLTDYPIHIEIDTGMNRLGFNVSDLESLGQHLAANHTMRVQSVFTHLVASEDPALDAFTDKQAVEFRAACALLGDKLGYAFLKHISNSAAIIRKPALQMDMVRLGIGLYGVDLPEDGLPELQPVASLKSTIAQIRKIHKGESVSYNRSGIVTRDSVIATVRIGYADGYPRVFGNGRGKMLVHGILAPVIGNVCMDMTMIDISDIPGVDEGDPVILFNDELRVEQLAGWAGTIPYEIMTGISQRVKRVYFEE